MLEILRKKARKSNIWRIVLSVAGVVILLAITKFAIFDVITGPTRMDITEDPASYEGKYVTIDAEFFLYDYVEHTTTTKKKYGGSSTSTDGYSYIAFQWVDDYENDASVWYFYSIFLKKDRQNEMNSKIDQAFAYLSDETGSTPPPEPVTVTGVWNKMDYQTEEYFRSSMAELGITESEYDKFYFYELDTKNIGGVNGLLFWVMMAGAVGLLAFAALSAVGLFSDSYSRPIQQYLQKEGSVSMAAIEEDFHQARLIGSGVWVGKRWTIYIQGSKAKILANKDLVWGYYFRRTGRNSVSEMRLFTKERNRFGISLSEENTQEALRVYEAEQPHMVIGYSAELEKMYNKDFNAFLGLKYHTAARETEF